MSGCVTRLASERSWEGVSAWGGRWQKVAVLLRAGSARIPEKLGASTGRRDGELPQGMWDVQGSWFGWHRIYSA